MRRVYFSHPLPMHRTKTEEDATRILSRQWKGCEVINPFTCKKSELESLRRSCEIMAGLAIDGKYPFIVWNDLNVARDAGTEIFTLNYGGEDCLVPSLLEGLQEDFEKLSYEDTQKLYRSILGSGAKSMISSLFLGKFGRKRTLF